MDSRKAQDAHMSGATHTLLHDALGVRARENPQKPCLIAGSRSYSYAELQATAESLARGLISRGLVPGDRVAILMENGFPCVAAIYGALMAGAVFLTIHPQTKVEKLAFLLENSSARFLLTDVALADQVCPLLLRNDVNVAAVVVGLEGSAREGAWALPCVHPWSDVLKIGPALQGKLRASGDLAALIYTSGSTGQPKGVMMSHASMVFACGSLIHYLKLGAEERILNILPLAFDYGLYQLLMTVHLGATLVLEQSYTFPASLLTLIEKEEITVFPGVPTVFAMLRSMHKRRPFEFPLVKKVTNTAAALPKEFLPDLAEMFPKAQIYKMYGLTECKRVSYLEPGLLAHKPGSVGQAIPGTKAFVLRDDGSFADPHEVGILHVQGPHVMLGYWGRQDLSDEMLRPCEVEGERVLCTHVAHAGDFRTCPDRNRLRVQGRDPSRDHGLTK